jgi:hypothetical protein
VCRGSLHAACIIADRQGDQLDLHGRLIVVTSRRSVGPEFRPAARRRRANASAASQFVAAAWPAARTPAKAHQVDRAADNKTSWRLPNRTSLSRLVGTVAVPVGMSNPAAPLTAAPAHADMADDAFTGRTERGVKYENAAVGKAVARGCARKSARAACRHGHRRRSRFMRRTLSCQRPRGACTPASSRAGAGLALAPGSGERDAAGSPPAWRPRPSR